MAPKVRFRYGLDKVARGGLLLWSVGWLFGVVYVLVDGKVNSEGRGGATTYTREDHPTWYWTTIFVMSVLFLFGLALTFEVSFRDNEDSEDKKRD